MRRSCQSILRHTTLWVLLTITPNVHSYLEKISFLQFLSNPKELNCQKIPKIVDTFLQMHYSYRSYKKMSTVPSVVWQRLTETYPKKIDPRKILITKESIEQYRASIPLFQNALKQLNCGTLVDPLVEHALGNINKYMLWLSNIQPQENWFEQTETVVWNTDKRDWPSIWDIEKTWLQNLKIEIMLLYKNRDKKDVKWTYYFKQAIQRQQKYLERTKNHLLKPDYRYGLFSDALASGLDPHSSFLTLEETNEFKMNFSLNLVGIGATLQQDPDGVIKVHSIVKGGAADKDKRLKKDDIIEAVLDKDRWVDLQNFELKDAVQMIRGPESTPVTLRILRSKNNQIERFIITLMRTKVEIENQKAKSEVISFQGKKIGVIHLPSFYVDYDGRIAQNKNHRDSATDIAQHLINLKSQHIDGLVFDIRGNSGGDLKSCIEIAGLFLGHRPIAQIVTRQRGREILFPSQNRPPLFDGPIVVLVDDLSASSSEILALSIQDWGRGIIVGSRRTFGKSTIQNVVEDNYGSFKATIGAYYGPSGRSVQKVGLQSDVILPSILEILNLSEASHPYALSLSPISPHPTYRAHKRWWIESLLPQIQRRSQERILKNPFYQKKLKRIEQLKQNNDRDTVTISLEPTKSPETEKEEEEEKLDEDSSESRKIDPETDPDLKEGLMVLIDWMSLYNQHVEDAQKFFRPQKQQG